MRIQYNAPVVLTFCLLSTAVLLLNEHVVNHGLDWWFSLDASWNFSQPAQYPRLLSYTMGHADMNHLMGNMTFLLLLGPIMEEKYGSKNIATMMLLCGLVSGILSIILFPEVRIMGASGIVFMFIVLVSFADMRSGSIPLTFILVILLFLGKEVFNSFNDNTISEFGHIAGGICGAVFGFISKRG